MVVDIAGPVPLIVEGARLAALAAGQPPPPAHEDPDIRAAVAEVIGDFTLEPGAPDADLEIAFRAADQAHAAALANQLAARLQPRLHRLRLRLAPTKSKAQVDHLERPVLRLHGPPLATPMAVDHHGQL